MDETSTISAERPGMTLKQVIEALVFATQKPLTPKEIVSVLRSACELSEEPSVAQMAKTKEAEITATLEELREDYESLDRSFQLIEEVSGWRLLSKNEFGLWVRQLFPENRPTRLSAPALETLAIVAYRQPITKADIEAVRGVAVDGVLQTLLDRSLVKIAGRAEIAGRPLLYETTQHFLEHFGLKTTDELPNASELKRIQLPTAADTEKKTAEAAPLDPETPSVASAPVEEAAVAEADSASEAEAASIPIEESIITEVGFEDNEPEEEAIVEDDEPETTSEPAEEPESSFENTERPQENPDANTE